jgi:hypothetical protein
LFTTADAKILQSVLEQVVKMAAKFEEALVVQITEHCPSCIALFFIDHEGGTPYVNEPLQCLFPCSTLTFVGEWRPSLLLFADIHPAFFPSHAITGSPPPPPRNLTGSHFQVGVEYFYRKVVCDKTIHRTNRVDVLIFLAAWYTAKKGRAAKLQFANFQSSVLLTSSNSS